MNTPQSPPTPRPFWRTLWIVALIASIVVAVIGLQIDGLLTEYRRDPFASPSFRLLDGVLAFLQLSAWTLMLVSGCGWILTGGLRTLTARPRRD